MAKIASRLRRRSVIFSFFAVFLLLSASPAFGRGSRESELTRADELINQRQFDAAIQLLTEFSRNNPEHFNEVQQRLSRINQIREEFNRTADELIRALMYEPENDDKILALSNHLYTLEDPNSTLIINFVARAREIAQFNVNRNRLRNILERGRNLLDAGNAVAAINTYAEGLDFMREEFFLGGFGADRENEVLRETESINSMLAAFQQASTLLGTISAEYVGAVNSQDISRIQETSNRLILAMDNFIGLNHSLYTSASVFNRLMNEIRVINPEIVDRNHLSFLSAIIHGRPNDSIQEGMLGAFEISWKNSVGSVVNTITSYVERAKNAAITAINAGNYPVAISSLDRVDYYANLSPLFFNKNRQFFEGAQPPTVTLHENNILRTDIPPFMEIIALSEANNFLLQAANIPMRQNIDRSSLTRWQEGSLTTAEALRNEQQARNDIIEIQRAIEDIRINANRMNAEINLHHQVTHITDVIRAIENIRTVFLTEEHRSVQRYYAIALHNFQNNLTARRVQLENGRSLLDGQDVPPNPAEALQIFNTMLAASAIDLENVNSVFNQFRNEPAAITSVPEIATTNAGYQNAVTEMNSLRTQAQALTATAGTRTARAEMLRQEGERLFREAELAFQRQDYETARRRIIDASDRFRDSLELQESASVHHMRDTQLISLGQTIAVAETQIIIAEVRNLVNNARNLYFNGNFQLAQDNLLRARSRWSITGQDANEEIEHWLRLVHIALNMNVERVISPTAPLFPEMSQLLSQAQRNFEEGQRYINTGQRAPGMARFDEARQLTREVRLVFPFNQEAGLLDLRIEQFLDPPAFNAAFEQRLNTARAGTRQQSIVAFADLLNLAEINPQYPNMRAIIIQAEIDMGIRLQPPNPADIALSRDLTAAARRIADADIVAQYEIAMTQLDQAIRLNPQNTEALQVRDRLLQRMNLPGAIVLTRDDELAYNEAERHHLAGNNLAAYAILQRLMQNPQNRNVEKLARLYDRVRPLVL
jgi:hypothetical protein